MRKSTFILFAILSFYFAACSPEMVQQANTILKGQTGALSEEEAGRGIKEALTKGIEKGVQEVSVTNGFYGNSQIKIPMPQEAQNVEKKLRAMGLGSEVDKAIVSLNRAAEEAAKEAKPIFVSAIRQMTIRDAFNIVRGEDDAATQYLNRTTSTQLHAKFKPIISRSLQKVNATRYWSDIMTQYNKIPFVQKVETDLEEYVTQKAIDGLFVMVAKEEKEIRENPAARTTALLKKVFGERI
jgi:hypothetical protein